MHLSPEPIFSMNIEREQVVQEGTQQKRVTYTDL
jgi:hypothetical protein